MTGPSEPRPDLAALCAELAGDLDEVAAAREGDVVTYARDKVPFARATATTLDVRLPADIAEAAMRTPDTADAGERGWVRFAPHDAERHVVDRAEAWFHTAWRHAADAPRGRT